MHETVIVCAWSNARQPVHEGKMPEGWVALPAIVYGDGTDEGDQTSDLHFVSYDALSQWAASRHLRHRTTGPRSARTWASDLR